MSSALSLIVLGQVYFIGPVSIGTSTTPNGTQTPTIYQGQNQLNQFPGVRRNDYTYTPGIGGHKVHTVAATWNVARKTCEGEGGHLAIINSVAESEILAKLFQESRPHTGTADSSYVHVGFHDLYQENDFVTVHGEPLTTVGFNEWQGGGPNNDRNDENCGSIFTDGKLNDISCKKTVGFICELPFVSENSIAPQ